MHRVTQVLVTAAGLALSLANCGGGQGEAENSKTRPRPQTVPITDVLARASEAGDNRRPSTCPDARDAGAFAPDAILRAERRIQERTVINSQGTRYRLTAKNTQMQLLVNLADGVPSSAPGGAYNSADAKAYYRAAAQACGTKVARRTWLLVWSSSVEIIVGSHVQFWARTPAGWRAWWELYP